VRKRDGSSLSARAQARLGCLQTHRKVADASAVWALAAAARPTKRRHAWWVYTVCV